MCIPSIARGESVIACGAVHLYSANLHILDVRVHLWVPFDIVVCLYVKVKRYKGELKYDSLEKYILHCVKSLS